MIRWVRRAALQNDHWLSGGHADAAMTLNVYGHLFPDRLHEVASTLDARRLKALKKRDEDAA